MGLISLRLAGEISGMGEGNIRRAIRDGSLKYVKPHAESNHMLIEQEDLERFLGEHGSVNAQLRRNNPGVYKYGK
jgi:hypothetical protein